MRDQAIAWLLRLRDKPSDNEVRQAFSDWLAADPAHRIAYRQAEAQWAWMEPFKEQSFPARDEALRYRLPARQPLWRKLASYSAAAAVLLGVGFALFSPGDGTAATSAQAKDSGKPLRFRTAPVWNLNTDTEVQVRINYHRRHVELVRGEAFFNVAHHPERPFDVHAGNVDIRDIGTAFDVYKQADQVSVAVQEGVVEIKGRAAAGS